ncbi:hypothetical protein HKCCE3408_15970 [Rhodobacterales bacterium HKCCE3408]|nr:hypothetical protein [Rhodobacterales bacterium HKCCE3408]
MEVHGITDDRAYRVSFTADGRRIDGLIPEAVVASEMGLPPRPPHGAVYFWIAKNQGRIEQTLIALTEGNARPKPPFDALALAEETR